MSLHYMSVTLRWCSFSWKKGPNLHVTNRGARANSVIPCLILFWYHNRASVAEGQIIYTTPRSHVDKIMRCKGDESAGNTYRSSCWVDSQLLMATVLACVLLASGIWLGGSSTATLNLVKRSRGKGKLSFLDEEREGRRGRHVEERTRITGERIKGRERWDKRLHVGRISGPKDILKNACYVDVPVL